MNKKISVFFILTLFLLSLSSIFSIKTNLVKAEEKLELSSKSALLVDANTNTIIYNKNEKVHAPIASMCKVMTLLISFDEIQKGNISLEDEIIVSENASKMGGSQVFLESNGKYKIKNLLKAITIASANDASVAMAEIISGSEEQFVSKMNEKAKELGMNNTCFVNCTGLPKDGQYSCALDVYNMFSALIKHSEYFNFSTIWMEDFVHPENRITKMSNTNKLIRFYEGCDSGKTGYTSEAGHCLVASANRGNMRLISVIISAPDSKTRFKEASNLFNYGYNNFENKTIIDSNKQMQLEMSIKNSKNSVINVVSENSINLFNRKNQKRAVEVSFEMLKNLKAPILKGEVLGKVCIYENGVEIASSNILADEDICVKGFGDVLDEITLNWPIR